MVSVLVQEMSKHMGHTLSDALLTPTTTTPTTTSTDTSVIKEGEKEVVKKVVNTPTQIQPFHFDTIQYLNGILLTICLECLYSKDTNSNYIHANTIKNILSIDPTLGHIVLPFLINALTTVNQSHQTPIALYTLNLTFKILLYPMPIILYYIPSLLQYTLPGLDPADQMKTVLTLSYISTILAWIPTMSTYKINTTNSSDNSNMSYLTLLKRLIVTQVDSLATIDLTHLATSDITSTTLVTQSYYDALASYLPQYFSDFFDKIFLLLQAQEGTQNTNNTNTSSNSSGNNNKGHNSGAMPSICECVGYIFQGINSIKIREQVEDKVLLYFKNNTLINSVKTCAKILEYMVSIAVY